MTTHPDNTSLLAGLGEYLETELMSLPQPLLWSAIISSHHRVCLCDEQDNVINTTLLLASLNEDYISECCDKFTVKHGKL